MADEVTEAPSGLVKIDAADVDAGWKFVEINGDEHKAYLAAQAAAAAAAPAKPKNAPAAP